jgi:hypothetical protein
MTKIDMQSALEIFAPSSTVSASIWKNGGGHLIQLHFWAVWAMASRRPRRRRSSVAVCARAGPHHAEVG